MAELDVGGIKFKGALVYINDFEGKISKFNLTNMSDDGQGNSIKLYDSTVLLSIDANTLKKDKFDSLINEISTIGHFVENIFLTYEKKN